jgi:hypothetical protein
MSRFFQPLYKITRLERLFEKTASKASELSELKLGLWNQIKTAAQNNPIEIAKIAIDIFNSAEVTSFHNKTASESERDMTAVAFATASVVDTVIGKQAALGEITKKEAAVLYQINADSAINDLQRITKLADGNWYNHPAFYGALGAGSLGAGIGAWGDDDNRLRGAAVGGLTGAGIGALGGLAVDAFRDEARSAADIARNNNILNTARAGKTTAETEEIQQRLANTMADRANAATKALADQTRLAQEAIANTTSSLIDKQNAAKHIHERLLATALNIPANKAGEVAGPLQQHAQEIIDHIAAGNKDLPGHVMASLGKNYAKLVEKTNTMFPFFRKN